MAENKEIALKLTKTERTILIETSRHLMQNEYMQYVKECMDSDERPFKFTDWLRFTEWIEYKTFVELLLEDCE